LGFFDGVQSLRNQIVAKSSLWKIR